MADNTSLLRAAAHPMNTDGVKPLAPTLMCRAEKCEYRINIGLFFDGTGNNQDWEGPEFTGGTQLQRKKDSNVARLFRAYPDDHLVGYYPRYIPGVGTPFPAVGEDMARDKLGMGFGAGGDARIVYGLLQVLNAGTEGHPNRLSPAEQGALDAVGMKDQGGLLTMNGVTHRTTFLKTQLAQLAQKISDTRHPKLREVFIDVFGFSRGAAQARVFCNWLAECFDGDTLAGVKAHIRFLGIFDTVAAVGLGPAAGQWANGHGDWGNDSNLRISPKIHHCEHYVAMHEQRESFPLEDVQTPGDAMPPNCRQFRFPGMHSDLGGAYLPNEQGKNGGADNCKLSQIPLNQMHNAARAALVPLKQKLALDATIEWDPFEISEKLAADYTAFIKANRTGVREIADCLIDILAWRFLFRDDYRTLPFVQRADVTDQRHLLGAHEIFRKDIREIHEAKTRLYYAQEGVATSKLSLTGQVFRLSAAEDEETRAYEAQASIPAERQHIHKLITARKLSPAELDFFSEYCHDSYAGFRPFEGKPLLSRNGPWEASGYLKFRTRYAGESLRLAMLESLAASADV
jgi:hypothetical protein